MTRLHEFKLDDTLDPSELRFIPHYRYLDNLGIRLFQINNKGEYEGMLADKFSFSDDRKKLVISLREAYFKNGSQIEAKHVVQTIKRVILMGSSHNNPKSFIDEAESLSSLKDDISGLKVISPKQLLIKLRYPVKEILYYLQLADYTILSDEQVNMKKILVRDWISNTSGPYSLNIDSRDKIYFSSNKKSIQWHKDMPQKIYPKEYQNIEDFYNAVANEEVQFGNINLDEILKYGDEFNKLNFIDLFSTGYDGIVYLILNVNSELFKNGSHRKWIYRKFIHDLKIPSQYRNYITKANQFFLPKTRGYLKDSQILKKINSWDLSIENYKFPKEFTIRTTKGMKNFFPQEIKEQLSSLMGVNINYVYDVDGKNYSEFLGNRNFDAHLMATSMSYKVIGEALNLQYLSSPPALLDPSGKVRTSLEKYQNELNKDRETVYINEIMLNMAEDAELIPLYYYTSAKMVNTRLLNPSLLNLMESFQFWRLRVR